MTVERVEDEGCFLSLVDILQSCSNSCLQSTENIELYSSVNIMGEVGGRKGEDSCHQTVSYKPVLTVVDCQQKT